MEKEKIIASRCKLRVDKSDGTFTEIAFEMPDNLVSDFIGFTLDWEDRVFCTPNQLKSYEEELKKLEK